MRYTLICCCLMLSLPAMASDIYRWVDDQGVVHYTDRPDRQGAERLTMRVNAPSTPTPPVSQPREQSELMSEGAADPEDTAAARQANCQAASQRLQSLQAAPRLFREGAGGAREYLTDAEIELVLAEAAELVDAWCD